MILDLITLGFALVLLAQTVDLALQARANKRDKGAKLGRS